MNRSTGRGALALALWVAVSFVPAAVGAIASARATETYAALEQPTWAPPSWVFGPVWTLLYALMGVAAWLVWRAAGWDRARGALTLFLAHLVLNGLWTWLFFAWELRGLAAIEIGVLWLSIVVLVVLFWRVTKLAGALLLPYLAWVTFAAALNVEVWRRNLTGGDRATLPGSAATDAARSAT